MDWRHSRVGSSSGSGVSCGGRCASGTWRRLTRMRVHVEDRPRMESTRMSSMARRPATWAYLRFHLSRPSRAASLLGELATTMSGILVRDGATRGASPSILRKCGGQGASASPAASSFAARSSRVWREPGAASMSAWGSPRAANRFGIVRTVKSAGSQSETSCQWSGVDTRASGRGRTEYAEQVVRSFAFWL